MRKFKGPNSPGPKNQRKPTEFPYKINAGPQVLPTDSGEEAKKGKIHWGENQAAEDSYQPLHNADFSG